MNVAVVGAGYVGLVLMGLGFSALVSAAVPARRRGALLIGLPAALVLADWVRSNYPYGGLPIGAMALGQAGGPLAPAVRLGGSSLLTGAIALTGTGLYGELADTEPLLAMRKVLSSPPVVDPSLPPAEAELVMACLAPDPADRPPTALAVAERIEAL